MSGWLEALPWLLPALAAVIVASPVLAPALARVLRTSIQLGWLLLVALALVLAATLTPASAPTGAGTELARGCDTGRLAVAPIEELWPIGDTALNIALFLPLGAVLAALPWGRRTVLLVAAVLVLPLLIELVQSLLPALTRGCETADVVDNLTGLFLGSGPVVLARGVRAVVARS